MAVPIAELFVAIGADISGAVSGLNQLDSRLRGTTSAMQRTAPAARALTAAGVGITAAFVDAIRVGSDFESAMGGVRAQMNPVEMGQFSGEVRELARTLGKQTKFSAKEAAQGIEELLKLGVPVQDVLKGAAQAALTLAVATGVDVATAGAVAASAMNAFGVSVQDMPDVVQALTGVTQTTAADMNDMRLALSDVGSTAAQMGLSFRDTATAIGIFRDVGFTGNTAGTALKTMLIGLQPQTEKETKLFRELGLITAEGNNIFFDAQGRLKDVASIAGLLTQKFGHLNRQQRTAIFQTIFGNQGMQAANALFGVGADRVRKYAQEIGLIDPAESARKRTDHLRGDLEKLRSAFQDVQIEIHDMVEGPLRRFVQGLTRALDAIGDWTPEMRRFAAQSIFAAGALATMVGGFVLLAPFIAAIPIAFAVLTGVLGVVSAGLLGLAVAAKALKIAWDQNMFGIRDTAAQVFSQLPEFFGRVRHQIIFLNTVLDNMILTGLQKLEVFINTMLNPALAVLATRFDEVRVAAQPIADTLEALRSRIQPILESLFAGGVGGAAETALGGLGGAFGSLGDSEASLDTFRTAVSGVGAAMAILGIGGPVGAAVIGLLSISGALLAAYQNNEQFKNSVNALRAELAPLEAELARAFGPIVQFAEQNGPGVISTLQRIGEVLATSFREQIASLQPFAASLGNLFNALGRVLEAVVAIAGDEFQAIFERSLVPALQNFVASMGAAEPILRTFADAMAQLPTIGQRLEPFTNAINTLANALNLLADALAAGRGNIPDWLIDILGQAALGPFGQFGGPRAPGLNADQSFGQPVGAFAAPPPGGEAQVNIGTVNIGSEVDADNFLNRLAQIISGSASRAEPPVESQTPGMVPQPVTT